ncbi:MAG: hypothetical protein Ct9H300mP17_10150 [Candidatus Nitrosopelagicus sp.]|nr:MAG: hypothetical protein Ct9H300mP17_10150 [Candidatus Nitrosopelagicus sp.]
MGDLDGDGVNELAVGAVRHDETGNNRGTLHLMFMNTNGSVKSTVEINDSTTNGPTLDDGDRFGIGVDSMGDLDGNGIIDLVVGAHLDDEGGDRRGTVHFFVQGQRFQKKKRNNEGESMGFFEKRLYSTKNQKTMGNQKLPTDFP